jgi:hypothetical protein
MRNTSNIVQYYDKDQIRWGSRASGHIGGMMSLMRTLDPEGFAEPTRHELFKVLRQSWVRSCSPRQARHILICHRFV